MASQPSTWIFQDHRRNERTRPRVRRASGRDLSSVADLSGTGAHTARQDFGPPRRGSGRFLALIPNERIVRQAEFESADPAFAGTMTIT
jgi:hypothetical protein